MPSLIDTIDLYGDFNKESYFVLCFDKLASILSFKTPLEETKEQMKTLIEVIDFKTYNLEVVFKCWNTEDAKNADFSTRKYEICMKPVRRIDYKVAFPSIIGGSPQVIYHTNRPL